MQTKKDVEGTSEKSDRNKRNNVGRCENIGRKKWKDIRKITPENPNSKTKLNYTPKGRRVSV